MSLSGLRGITYSEFDNIVGPQLRFSYPPDLLPMEAFEPLSDYAIVGKHLCGKIILVKTEDLQFVNYSVSIENSKYERNTLLFSFGFVLDRDVAPEPYEPLLRKLSSVMVSLELESEFLFHDKQKLEGILQTLYSSLRHHGEAFMNLDEQNFLALKFFKPISPQPPEIRDYEVPVLVYSKLFMSSLPWDISLQHLFPCIDGVRHVTRIARDAEMDLDCVKRCLRVLQFYKCIIMTDIFHFTNVYQQCEGLGFLDHGLLAEFESFCAIDGSAVLSEGMTMGAGGLEGGVTPKGRQIVRLLLSLRAGRTIGELLSSAAAAAAAANTVNEPDATDTSPQFGQRGSSSLTLGSAAVASPTWSPPVSSAKTSLAAKSGCAINLVGLDLRRLLAFAQSRGLIRRLHEYPTLGRRRAQAAGSPDEDDGGGDCEGDGDGDGDESEEGALSSLGSAQSSVGRIHESMLMRLPPSPKGVGAVRQPGGSGGSGGGSGGGGGGGVRGPAEARKTLGAQWAAMLDGNMLRALDGSMSLDAFCCKFEAPPAAVLHHPCIYIIYK